MSSAASASLPPSRPNLPSLELATGLGPIHPARLYSVLHATKRFQGLGFLFCHSNQFRELEAASGCPRDHGNLRLISPSQAKSRALSSADARSESPALDRSKLHVSNPGMNGQSGGSRWPLRRSPSKERRRKDALSAPRETIRSEPSSMGKIRAFSNVSGAARSDRWSTSHIAA
jgi:hypothetical protein